MKSLGIRIAAVAVVALVISLSAKMAPAQDMYWRVDPAFIAPAPYTYQYGMVGSPPPYYIYEPAPVVYGVPAEGVYVETIPVGAYDYSYRFDYSLQPSYRYSTRHYRMDYKVDGRDPYGGRVRYRYSYNRGRLKAKLRYRP